MEEAQQKMAVEGKKGRSMLRPYILALLHQTQLGAQVVVIAIKEALFLNEIDEHEPVEHERGIPLTIGFGLDTFDELEEGRMFGLKAVVEPPGDAIHVEGPDALSHRRNGEGLFFLQREGDCLELLNQPIAWLVFVEGMFTTCGWPAQFT